MRYIKLAGFLWALIYLVVGYLKSFTLNNIDFWSSVTLASSLFVLPLPIVAIALWSQKIAGSALLLCIVASFIAATIIAASHSHSSSSFADKLVFMAFIALYSMPHFVFAIAYILMGKRKLSP